MGKELIYTPVFRSRQEENKVLKEFNFGSNIYPLIEIIKSKDRATNKKSFEEIYGKLLKDIQAQKVLVDLPLYLNERRSTKPDILDFTLRVISNWKERTSHLLSFSALAEKIIPVVGSYIRQAGSSYLTEQLELLRPKFNQICFRVGFQTFLRDWNEIEPLLEKQDFLIIDFDQVNSAPGSSAIKEITETIKSLNLGHRIILRSSINNEVANKDLENDQVIYEADNSLQENFREYGGDSFADYAGIKKDNLTSGGSISPGFIFYDGAENLFFGFRYINRRDLDAFKQDIVPAVLRSEAARRMVHSNIPFLSGDNLGWKILNDVYDGRENGKSQAKFKRVSMLHYLHCIKALIENNVIK